VVTWGLFTNETDFFIAILCCSHSIALGFVGFVGEPFYFFCGEHATFSGDRCARVGVNTLGRVAL
jgi:hypothetical protein